MFVTLADEESPRFHRPLDDVLDERHARFRRRVREAVGVWSRVDVDGWEAAGRLPRRVFAHLGRAGLFEERWAEGRTGGLGHAVVLAEELALVSGSLGLAVTLHCEVFLGALDRLAGTGASEPAAIRDAALRGEAIGCFAVTEPRGGSDVGGVVSSATRHGTGWRIDADKRYISNAATATHALMLLRSGAVADDRGGLTAFVLPLDVEAVERRGAFPKLGTHGCDASHLVVRGDFPAWCALGREGAGLLLLMRGLEQERLSISCQLLSVARTALRLAGSWARARAVAGGRLIDAQAARHRLADQWVAVQAAEALVAAAYRAAGGPAAGRLAAAAKLHAAGTTQVCLDEVLQLLGGRGYSANFPVERWVRDARLARIGAGTDEVMRELVGETFRLPDEPFDRWLDELVAADRALPYPDIEPADIEPTDEDTEVHHG